MYTIKQAAQLTGVSESSLRAWERRYDVVSPRRTAAGYRVYDDDTVAAVRAMRSLVDAGWSPALAARAVREGDVLAAAGAPGADAGQVVGPHAAGETERFLTSARLMRSDGIEESLDRGFAVGSFEHVVDSWLFPTLEALGEGWSRGEIDVAAEHAASHAVHRRLSAAFEAAASRSTGPAVVVGLPPDSRHELGALAFATALRRRGFDVLYLGADVPVDSWEAAVRAHHARAAVLAVVMTDDRPQAAAVVDRLEQTNSELTLASGGASGRDLGGKVRALPDAIGSAGRELDVLLR